MRTISRKDWELWNLLCDFFAASRRAGDIDDRDKLVSDLMPKVKELLK